MSDTMPVFLAALEATGADPKAATWTREEIEDARGLIHTALRGVDRVLDKFDEGDRTILTCRLRWKP